MNRVVIGVLAGLLASGVAWAQQSMPVMELTAGIHRIEAEVASNQENRMVGLMRREAMAQQHGMLFVFPELNTHCMWMKNTLLPLSVAFIDEEGVVINVEDMKPQTEDNHCARRPARFALEMNQGWFAKRGLGPGTKLNGLSKAPLPR